MINIHSKMKIVIQSGVFAFLIGLNSTLFAATDSSASFIPTTNPKNQYLLVDSQNPSSNTPSTNGASNVLLRCANDEQLIGVMESNTGYDQDPGSQPYARQLTYVGNYVYVPRCAHPSILTGECRRDWVKEYSKIDTLLIICAKNSLHWENKNEHTTPVDPNAVPIGAYVPPT